MIRALVVCAVLASACKSESGNSDLGSTEVSGSGSAKAAGSAGGFSATLSSDLAKGSDTPAPSAGSGSAAMASSGSAAMASSGSAAMAGSGSAAMASSGSAAMAGSGSVAMASSGSAAMAGGAAKAGSGAGSAAAIVGSAAKAGSGAGSAAAMVGSAAMAGSAAKPLAKPIDKPKPVQVSGDLAAIKISLLPNWVRDVDEAGTISLTVTVQSRNEVATFRFHYGYDLAGAPNDRDQYKKFLMEQKAMAVTADRQRGAAWYLEGVDSDGKASFRFLTTYGGKRLVCYGSLYKDSSLGDIRDEVIIQAKKICETLAL
jgi:hypothetical protein